MLRKNIGKFIIVLLILSFFGACDNSNPTAVNKNEINPFSNGSNERNLIVVISDIHLGADLSYAECNKNLPKLEKFLLNLSESKNVKELVIAGDLLDEWFIPADVNTYNGLDQADFIRRIAEANKGVVDAFKKIIQGGNIKVTYVPGNHDLTITDANVELILPGINQARDAMQGLGTYSPTDFPLLAVEHGHRYNFFCAPDPISNKDIAPGSIMPPGYFFTRLATLHVKQHCTTPNDVLPTITQNISGGDSQFSAFLYWNMWHYLVTEFPIENNYSDKIIVTNIDGFTENYSVNDLVPYQLTSGGFIDMKLYKGIQDTWEERQRINKVPIMIPASQAITKAIYDTETDNQAINQYFMNAFSNKRIVVFGHSHAARIIGTNNYKGQKCVYANSGTWIDVEPKNGIGMSFVVITPQNSDASSKTFVRLYDFENGTANQVQVDSLRL